MQNGLLFGLPVVFDTHSEKIKPGDKVLLTYQGQNIATLTVDSKWMPNKPVEALKCYGTSSIEHPAVQMISMERGKYYIGRFCYNFKKAAVIHCLPNSFAEIVADEGEEAAVHKQLQAGRWCMSPVTGNSEHLQMLMGQMCSIQALCEVKMLLSKRQAIVMVANTFKACCAYIMAGHSQASCIQ